MAPQIDFMVKSGLMDPQVAANHPDRNCLISVLMGTRIPKIDCPAKPFELMAGDIVVCASDGLQFLTNAQIEKVLGKYRKYRSTEIAERLLEELHRLDDPDQDNISFTVIKVNDASVRPKQPRPPRQTLAVTRPRGLTTMVSEPVLVPVPGPQDQPAADHEAPAAAGSAAQIVTEPSGLEAALAADGQPARVVPRRFAALG